jgi:hypothetical protein
MITRDECGFPFCFFATHAGARSAAFRCVQRDIPLHQRERGKENVAGNRDARGEDAEQMNAAVFGNHLSWPTSMI